MLIGRCLRSLMPVVIATGAVVLLGQPDIKNHAALAADKKLQVIDAQIKLMEAAVKKNPLACASHYALGKALCQRAKILKPGGADQAATYKRAVSALRTAIRRGKGNATAIAANQYLMSLPKAVVAPRTDADTPMIAAVHGISGLSRGAESTRPKVLEFYALWCQPCKMLKPIIEKAKFQYGDKIDFVSYNVDDPKTEKLMEDYEVSPIPTLIFLAPDNQVVSYAIGYSGESAIQDGLKKVLASEPTSSTNSTASSSPDL